VKQKKFDCFFSFSLKILNKKSKPTPMTISNHHEENEIMEQHDDNSGEQTDSGISSTFTNDMEQMFAETVNNVNIYFIFFMRQKI
jgi:hypothetical protein